MASYRKADRVRIPKGHEPERASGNIVAVNWPAGVAVYRDFTGALPSDYWARLAGWLEGWIFRQGGGADEISASYLILQLGVADGANKLSDRDVPSRVIGVGYGSEPVAPVGSADIELSRLAGETVQRLISADVTEVDSSQAFPW